MLIKTTETKEIEVEIELPAYLSYGGIVKITSPADYIYVDSRKGEKTVSIRSSTSMVEHFVSKGKKITAEEFESAFNEVKEAINNL